MKCAALAGVAALAACLAGVAAADSTPREPQVDRQEVLFGATRINAALGHGRLTVAVSRFGELTVLRWPNPSFFEHLNYSTANGEGARAKPLFGAHPNEGSFAALVLVRGTKVTVSWLRDEASWSHQQAYASEHADTLITRYRSDSLRVTVEGTDVVDPRRDVLARRYRVLPDGDAGYDSIALVYFENFAPNIEKDSFVPVTAQTRDDKRDYALVYHSQADALLHGSVEGRPSDLLDKLAAGADAQAVSAFLSAIADKAGVYIAVGGSTKSASYQCGIDAVDGAALASAGAQDAYDDAVDDGQLSSSPVATRNATGALRFDLGASGGESTVFLALADRASKALEALKAARAAGFDDARDASEKVWSDWLADARLPSTDDADRLRVARRALITIRTASDPHSGAVVASVATQPPYAEDWPRDGAFINYALDVAGKHAAVTRHNQSYARWQRKRRGEQVFGGSKPPAGSFAMNYYPDGVPSGFIPFEIDQVGLILWTFYRHATFLADDSARRAYLESIWSAIELAAGVLVSCKDEETKLQCAANEDDDPELSISLHGAVPTLLGLRSAVRAARYLGRTDQAEAWLVRVRELSVAFENVLYVPGEGYNGVVAGQRSEFWPPWRRTGSVAWSLWPGQVTDHGARQMRETAEEIRRQLAPFFDKQDNGGAYHAKGLIALAAHYHALGDDEGVALVKRWIDVLVKQVATPGTSHFGEAYLWADLDGDGKKEYANRVAIPHVWEATLVYLALMAAYDAPSLSPPHLAVVDPSPGARGCGVAARGARYDTLSLLSLLVLSMAWSMRRRRRRACARVRRRPSLRAALLRSTSRCRSRRGRGK